MKSKSAKAWAGRFAAAADPRMEAFTSSLAFDRRLARYDIQGSLAHCRMLVKQKLLSRARGTENPDRAEKHRA